jgi:hypothetical protein
MARVDLEAVENPGFLTPVSVSSRERAQTAKASRTFMASTMARLGVTDQNLIKPGIGEATRVILRRTPERVMVRDPSDPDSQHILILAERRVVPIEIIPEMPYRATTDIQSQT